MGPSIRMGPKRRLQGYKIAKGSPTAGDLRWPGRPRGRICYAAGRRASLSQHDARAASISGQHRPVRVHAWARLRRPRRALRGEGWRRGR